MVCPTVKRLCALSPICSRLSAVLFPAVKSQEDSKHSPPVLSSQQLQIWIQQFLGSSEEDLDTEFRSLSSLCRIAKAGPLHWESPHRWCWLGFGSAMMLLRRPATLACVVNASPSTSSALLHPPGIISLQPDEHRCSFSRLLQLLPQFLHLIWRESHLVLE